MTADELHQLVANNEKSIRDRIDDYKDTIYAILGFCSLWFFDAKTRTNRSNVKTFQGRHLSPLAPKSQADVCPDLGIVIADVSGVLGEVKKNFPKEDDKRKNDVFDQLKAYDQELAGWPTSSELLKQHDIVLLVHHTTSRAASDYWKLETGAGKWKFDRPFAIFEFSRSDQRVPYFFFRLGEGNIQEPDGHDLRHGVQVPMQALLGLYSTSKIYDAEPPLPYLLHLIWENVVVPIASEDARFAKLHQDQKIEIKVTVEAIVERLHEGFSFSHWHRKYPNRQPKVPKSEWVQKACQFLVEAKEAKWVIKDSDLSVYYRKYADVLEHFIKLQAESEANMEQQPSLLDYKANGPQQRT